MAEELGSRARGLCPVSFFMCFHSPWLEGQTQTGHGLDVARDPARGHAHPGRPLCLCRALLIACPWVGHPQRGLGLSLASRNQGSPLQQHHDCSCWEPAGPLTLVIFSSLGPPRAWGGRGCCGGTGGVAAVGSVGGMALWRRVQCTRSRCQRMEAPWLARRSGTGARCQGPACRSRPGSGFLALPGGRTPLREGSQRKGGRPDTRQPASPTGVLKDSGFAPGSPVWDVPRHPLGSA